MHSGSATKKLNGYHSSGCACGYEDNLSDRAVLTSTLVK